MAESDGMETTTSLEMEGKWGVRGGECMDVEEGWTPRKSPSGMAFVVGR